MYIAKSLVLAVAASFVMMLGAAPAAAQITINIPKIPKIKKDKPAPTTTSAPADTRSTPSTNTSTEISKASPAKSNDCSNDAVAQVHLKDLGETRQEAEEFRPGSRDYFVSTLSDRKNIYLEAALLPAVRQEWLGDWPADFKNCMGAALDGLAAAARRTITGYNGPAGYTLGTPAEKKALLSAINDIAEAKVLKVGIKQPNWLIAKDSYNFPTARYKHGVIWAHYPKTTHGFCWVFWVNIVQDYAGGGTYGASYGNYISRALAGCPAK